MFVLVFVLFKWVEHWLMDSYIFMVDLNLKFWFDQLFTAYSVAHMKKPAAFI